MEARACINVNVAMLTTAEQESGSSGNEGHARNLENPAGVLFQANVCSGSGAEENRAVALRLSRNGFVVQLAPRDQLEPRNGLAQSERRELERLTRQRVELAQSALYQVGSPDDWNLDFYGASRIGRTAFAADRLPNGWATRCNEMDEVWVPNRFCEETFAASGVNEKLRVVHTGVDTQRFRPGVASLESFLRSQISFPFDYGPPSATRYRCVAACVPRRIQREGRCCVDLVRFRQA